MCSRGGWQGFDQTFLGHDIFGSTVGIVGLGGIGLEVAKRVKAFDVGRILYCGPSEKPEG